MDDARIAYAIERMTALDLLGSGDATASGIGTMTEPRWRGGAVARWRETYEFLVEGKILPPATWAPGAKARRGLPTKTQRVCAMRDVVKLRVSDTSSHGSEPVCCIMVVLFAAL